MNGCSCLIYYIPSYAACQMKQFFALFLVPFIAKKTKTLFSWKSASWSSEKGSNHHDSVIGTFFY